ncbi:Gpsm1 [Symbiodinium sp. CCMP2456]|nr:Gpsm1 [Symbiodinium sp. CCMP2456]
MVHYEVVSCAELGGALVREGKSLTSQQLARLGIGAVVSELERVGERLRFKKVSGSGPESGWVSAKLLSKCDAGKAAPQKYQGKSLLAQAEAKILEKGVPQCLKEAGKDGPGRILASMAHLADGKTTQAAEAAKEAQATLKGNKEGEASATLALALAELSTEPKVAVGHAMAALSAYKEVGDKQMEASTLTAMANARLYLKELSVGEAAAKDALRLFREIGDTDGEEAAQITLLDILCAKDGPAAGAATVSKEQLAYYKAKGDKLGEGRALQKLAMSSAKDEAAKYAKDAAALFVQAGDKKAQAAALQTAALAQSTDRVSAAEEALKISKSIGDEAGQVDLLIGLSAVLSGEAALARAQEAQALAKKLGDRSGEARAKHAAAVATLKLEKSSEALELAKEAASILGEEKDTISQACALRTAASAASAAEACELLREAVSLSAGSGDRRAEAAAKLQLAAALLAFEGPLVSIFQNRTEAAAVAEQARVAFLLLGDKRSQGRASHLAAQSKILLDDFDGGVEAAMQAAVLGRSCGDRWLEACAMRTAVAGQVSKGCHAEALRMAKEVKSLFHKLGSSNIEEAMDSLIQQLEEVLPKIHPNPRVSVLPGP